jgi:cytochrome c oxidase cbb3-type subunit IV
MDLGIIRGIGTVLLLFSFVAFCLWVWAPAQRRRFEEAAALPFLDDDLSPQLKAGAMQSISGGLDPMPGRNAK